MVLAYLRRCYAYSCIYALLVLMVASTLFLAGCRG